MNFKFIINGKFLGQKTTGVQRYAREIIRELDALVGPDEIQIAIPRDVKDIPEYKNIKKIKVGKKANIFWEQVVFPLYAIKKKFITINLCNVAPLLSPGVVCIHDMKIKAKPQYFSKKFLLWYNILFFNASKRAKAIITVSNFSKNEIMKYYHVDSSKVFVVPNAWQHIERVSNADDTLKKYDLKASNYFFSMSSLEPNKNFKWIAEVAKNNPAYTFCIAGSINKTVFREGLGFDCPDNMKLLGFISDSEAKTLMHNCKAFLFPSFYEGFGIPPLEALAAGAKCVAVSDIDVMHELFDESVGYINPYSYNFNPNLLVEKSTQSTLSKFSWVKSAKQLLILLEKIYLFNCVYYN